jgi:flagella basal body P-ring formation protein FlgA
VKPPVESGGEDESTTLRAAVQAYFDGQLAAYGGRADVRFTRTAAQVLELSASEYAFDIQRRVGPPTGLVHLHVVIRRGKLQVQRLTLVLSVSLIRDVVVARHAINRGATVRGEDVHVVPRRFTRTTRLGVGDAGEVIGLRAQRFIEPGELMDIRDLEHVPLVRRGQIVEVVSTVGAITVNTAAKAADDGQYGEAVALHLQGRRSDRLAGRVVGPGRVQVGPSGGAQGWDGDVLAEGEH